MYTTLRINRDVVAVCENDTTCTDRGKCFTVLYDAGTYSSGSIIAGTTYDNSRSRKTCLSSNLW